jgi:hypothetical protein
VTAVAFKRAAGRQRRPWTALAWCLAYDVDVLFFDVAACADSVVRKFDISSKI